MPGNGAMSWRPKAKSRFLYVPGSISRQKDSHIDFPLKQATSGFNKFVDLLNSNIEWLTWRVDNLSTRRLHPSRISEELRSCPEAVVRDTTLHSPMPCWSTSRSLSAVKGSGINLDVYRQVQKWLPRNFLEVKKEAISYQSQNSGDQWGLSGSQGWSRRTEYPDWVL